MDYPSKPYYQTITRYFANAHAKGSVLKAVVDAPFADKLEATRMGLGIVVLLITNRKKGVIDRIALSNTELAKGTTTVSVKKFEDIKIPLDERDNIIAKAIRSGKPQSTADWHYLFTPALTAEEARLNQAGGAIAHSVVYPLAGKNSGALIFSYYKYPEDMDGTQEQFMTFYRGETEKLLTDFL